MRKYTNNFRVDVSRYPFYRERIVGFCRQSFRATAVVRLSLQLWYDYHHSCGTTVHQLWYDNLLPEKQRITVGCLQYFLYICRYEKDKNDVEHKVKRTI